VRRETCEVEEDDDDDERKDEGIDSAGEKMGEGMVGEVVERTRETGRWIVMIGKGSEDDRALPISAVARWGVSGLEVLLEE
jgi:hypothetical protein